MPNNVSPSLNRQNSDTIPSSFDVIVIGGGHAGTEAAHASAKMGCKTALVTLNKERIGFMSCNPAIGGLAKGQLVKEIDALGGIMGRNTDLAAIQYRILNSSKGPAVRSSRAQCDKDLYAFEMQKFLNDFPNLTLIEDEVASLIWSSEANSLPTIQGVVLGKSKLRLSCQSVVITAGTFMRAIMHTGFDQAEGGRAGDQAAKTLSQSLEELGFKLSRLKTGTPPRLDQASIDWSKIERQPGDEIPKAFSFYWKTEQFPNLKQIDCHITYTNEKTHQIIAANFDRSPMFTGVIKGIGPRYCPSIEDKVKRFEDKERHQIFLEPEGHHTNEIYVNGMSTSLPKDVQEKFIHSIVGLENAKFIRYGYAVEYDCVDAKVLKMTLESKDVSGLFLAGQVNGTSGYEEAGAQGLIAGINAALKVQNKEPFILSRFDSYIGVMIDDLTTKGTDEPYRMFTSRAEYRLSLREDNADLRLSQKGYEIGLLREDFYQKFKTKETQIKEVLTKLKEFALYPKDSTNQVLLSKGMIPLKDKVSGDTFLRRPDVTFETLKEFGFVLDPMPSADVLEQVEIQLKYSGYIQRDHDLMEGVRKNDLLKIPTSMNYELVPGLSTEVKNRLVQARPETIGQASRMSGVTPAAVANLLIYLRTR